MWVKRKGIIIAGFSGIGKTTLAKKYKNVIDLDASEYVYDETDLLNIDIERRKGEYRKPNPNWPGNYIEAIKKSLYKYDIVLVWDREDIIEEYIKNKFNFMVCYPSKNDLDNYVRRYKNRGNSDKYIKMKLNQYDNRIKLYDELKLEKVILNNNETIEDWLLKNNYLVKNENYNGDRMEEKIKLKLRELVDDKRYNHSIMVADEARRLAKNYNLDEEVAYLTGLCHDIAKNFTFEENEKWIDKYNLNKELLNDEYKKMIHADIGALVAKEWFDFSDEMCSAIKYHTICHSVMTDFEKIIFIADKTGRDNLSDEMIEIKELSYKNLDKAIIKFLINEEKYLKSKGLELHQEAKTFISNYKYNK